MPRAIARSPCNLLDNEAQYARVWVATAARLKWTASGGRPGPPPPPLDTAAGNMAVTSIVYSFGANAGGEGLAAVRRYHINMELEHGCL